MGCCESKPFIQGGALKLVVEEEKQGSFTSHSTCDESLREESDTSPKGKMSQTHLELEAEHFKDGLVKVQKYYPDIRHVQVLATRGANNQWIPTDGDIAKLRNLRNLTSIDITGCSAVTRNGLMQVSVDLSRIHTLILTNCERVSDNFLSNVVVFRNLMRLDLRGCFRVTDYGIDCLSEVVTLRHLDLSLYSVPPHQVQYLPAERITDSALESIASLPKLHKLELETCLGITDKGIAHIKTLGNLTCLNLSKTSVTDASLPYLAALPKLRYLKIKSCKVINAAGLSAMPELACLDISGGYMTDESARYLKFLLNLTYLNISSSVSLTDKGLSEIQNLPSLTWIDAGACTKITDKGIAEIAKIGRLHRLNLEECDLISIEGLKKFGHLQSLKHLEIGVSNLANIKLSELSSIKGLTDVTIHGIDATMEAETFDIPGINVHKAA